MWFYATDKHCMYLFYLIKQQAKKVIMNKKKENLKNNEQEFPEILLWDIVLLLLDPYHWLDHAYDLLPMIQKQSPSFDWDDFCFSPEPFWIRSECFTTNKLATCSMPQLTDLNYEAHHCSQCGGGSVGQRGRDKSWQKMRCHYCHTSTWKQNIGILSAARFPWA